MVKKLLLQMGISKKFFDEFIDAISYAKIYKSKYKLIINNLFIFEKLSTKTQNISYKEKIILQSSRLQATYETIKKFKKINFKGLEFYIPTDAIKYIEYIYGENWKIPQKKFSWWKIKNLKYE